MAIEDRRVYGSRPLGALVPRLTRPAFRKVSPATAQVMADWAAIMGPQLAAVTTPRRLNLGNLTVACTGPVAMELQHYAIELMDRINTHLGSKTVRTLRFVQTGMATPPVSPEVALPDPAVAAAAESAVAALPKGELRDALAALGRAVLAETGRK